MKLGSETTADNLLAGRSLRGKRIFLTGVSSGIGAETARVLVDHGATVVGAARNLQKARAATLPALRETAQSGSLELIELNLASLSSVHACADALLAAGKSFDAVIANAGVMAIPFETTTDGFETQFATNYLGHFVLINRTAKLFGESGRLVMVSSAGHRGADVDLDDPSFHHTPYDPLVAYRRSKTAVILFAVEFDRRYKARGVRATAVHPGAVLTETTRKMIEERPVAASAFAWKSVAQGAATPVWATLVAPPDEIGARYCEDCNMAEVNDDPTARFGVRSYAVDPERARALWLMSDHMVGENF